jgi:hypothetical protein
MLEGIQFVTNAEGERTAVLIDLKRYGELWEDFYDALIARQRADEPREFLELVREALKQEGKGCWQNGKVHSGFRARESGGLDT